MDKYSPNLMISKPKERSREVSCDLVGGSYYSKVMDRLRSRYRCVHEPPPAAATPDDRGYLNSLWVFQDGPQSRLHSRYSNLMLDQNTIGQHMIKEKIVSVLEVLKFREQHVLVQFWSPVAVRKQWLLTTSDQPFGLGVADEELYAYRLKSERCEIVVDEENRENLSPPGRVYSQKLPEWSLDAHGLDTCHNIHGYINMPVFESGSDCCVGVLEIVTSSNYVDFAFEVQEVSRALKNQNLKSSNEIEDSSFSIADERKRHELDEILNILNKICDIHNLSLAQTWAPSAYSSYVASSENLEPSCSSFNRSCIGKACMSTVDLPFYVRDLSMWGFHEACQERHLDKTQGVVGRSFSSCGTWFCEDVTELDEDDYPLVHHARRSGLTSCLAIYLQSLESDVERVIEIFLPSHTANEIGLRRLMETVKQQLKNSSWMQLDILLPLHVLGEISSNWYLDSPPSPINLLTEKGVVPPCESGNMDNKATNSPAVSTSQSGVPHSDKDIGDSDSSTAKTIKKRKRFHSSIAFEDIKKHFGKTIGEAAANLNVSRSTLKRICRSFSVPRWPYHNADVLTPEGSLTTTPLFRSSNEPFDGTTYVTHDPTVFTKNVLHQQEQANPPGEFVQPKTATVMTKETCRENGLLKGLDRLKGLVATQFYHEIGSFRLKYRDEDGDKILIACENDLMGSSIVFRSIQPNTPIRGNFFKTEESVTVKAKHENNTVKFTYRLLDGLERLKEVIARLFQLEVGSFRLKYMDEDGDMIMIACQKDLMGSSGAFTQPNDPAKTVVKLYVDLVTRHSSDA